MAIVLAALAQEPLRAQVPITTPPTPPASIPAYHAPVISLVQPVPGAPLPQDRAVLIFRFAPGEASDPVDASSFAALVNGASRTALFQVAAGEAWGPLSDSRTSAVPVGSYQVTARICSSKGACGTTSATVLVAASEATPPEVSEQATSRRQRVIDLLLAGVRRLLGP